MLAWQLSVLPITFKDYAGIVLSMASSLAGNQAMGKSLLAVSQNNIQCRKFILGGNIGCWCKCAKSYPNLDLIFDLAIVTPEFKFFLGYILETVQSKKLILHWDFGWEV